MQRRRLLVWHVPGEGLGWGLGLGLGVGVGAGFVYGAHQHLSKVSAPPGAIGIGGTRGRVRAVGMASGGAEPRVHAATTATILRI